MTEKRFKVVFIVEDNEWILYDSFKEKYYDIDLSNYEKEIERLTRDHNNLHKEYEKMESEYEKINYEYNKIIGNVSTAKRVYSNLKECFDD